MSTTDDSQLSLSEKDAEIARLRAEIKSHKNRINILNHRVASISDPDRSLARISTKLEGADYHKDFVLVYLATRGVFTEAQNKVACLLMRGMSSKEMAKKLFVIEKTIKFHKTQIYKIAGVKSALEFLVWVRAKVDELPKDTDLSRFFPSPTEDKKTAQAQVSLPQSQSHLYRGFSVGNPADKG